MKLIARLILYIYTQISKLPLAWLYAVADVIGWLMVHLQIFSINKEVKCRIEKAFPDETSENRRIIENNFYKNVANFGAEFVKFITWSDNEIANHINFKNISLLSELLAQHRYVVCYAGHFINYELYTGLPMKLDNKYGMCSFYDDTIRSVCPALNQWLERLRSRCGCICVPISSPLKKILCLHSEIETGKSQLKGFVIGSLLDTRKFGVNERRTLIMGEEFPLHYGTEKIGRRIGAAFVFAHINCLERGLYEVTLEQLNPDSEGSYMKAYINALERNIRSQPSLWLMWGSL